MAVQTKKPMEKDLVSELKNHLSRLKKMPDPYLGIIHRLDQPVSGILVFALNAKSAAGLSEQIREGIFNKRYRALTEGLIEGRGEYITLTDHLIKDKDKAGIVPKDTKGAKEAKLKYRVLNTDSEKTVTLLDIELITGRFHQIRAQLSNMGHPIVNDVKYGAKRSGSCKNGAIGLCAYELAFIHPSTKEELVYTISPEIDN